MIRREFFGVSGTFLSAWFLASCRSTLPRSESAYTDRRKVFLSFTSEKSGTMVRILDLKDDSFKDFPIPISIPHSLMRSMTDPDEVFAFGINGPSAILNIKTGKTSVCESTNSNGFHGHGLFVDDGKTLWCSEIIDKENTIITKRSGLDLKLVSDTSFPGGHHVARLPGTDLLVSGGNRPQGNFMSFFDMKAGKVIKEIDLQDLPVHFMPLSSTETIVLTGSYWDKYQAGKQATPPRYYTPILHVKTSGEVEELWGEKDLKMAFGFGNVNLPGGRFVTGHIRSNSVHLWENMKLKKSISLAFPQGIVASPDNKEVIVLAGTELIVLSTNDLKVIRTIKYETPIRLLSSY